MNPVTVVEAGSDVVKLVQVYRSGRDWEISKTLLHRFDKPDESHVGSLSEALRKLKLRKTPVIACLPRHAVNVRLLEVPSTDPGEIGDMVELQVGRMTPYSRDEIVADYRIVGRGRAGYTRVMLIIVHRSLMRQRFRLLEDAGLEVVTMSVGTEGILGWYRLFGKAGRDGKAVVLLDVDGPYTDLVVMEAGQIVFTRSVMVGAQQMAGESEKGMEQFAREVEHAMESYRSESHGVGTAGEIVLTGAGVHIQGLPSFLESRFKVEVRSLDCMSGARKGARLPDASSAEFRSASFTSLIGMALAPETLEFSLVPESVRMRRDLEEKARGLTALGVLAATVTVMLSLCTETMLHGRVSYLLGIRGALNRTSAEAREVEKMKQTTRMIERRLDSKRVPLSLLVEVHSLTPPEVYYDSISIEADRRVVLRGRAGTFPDVDKLRGRLDASKAMPDKIDSPKQIIRDGKVEFELVCADSRERGGAE